MMHFYSYGSSVVSVWQMTLTSFVLTYSWIFLYDFILFAMNGTHIKKLIAAISAIAALDT
jgi:hypothetical protein